MTYKELFYQIKEEQKAKAERIKELKASRKLNKRNGAKLWTIESDIYHLKHDFRHVHIAYCETRGRTRLQIEGNVKEGNEATQRKIDSLKDGWKELTDETNVCASKA